VSNEFISSIFPAILLRSRIIRWTFSTQCLQSIHLVCVYVVVLRSPISS
jgi:hypothetical protein